MCQMQNKVLGLGIQVVLSITDLICFKYIFSQKKKMLQKLKLFLKCEKVGNKPNKINLTTNL